MGIVITQQHDNWIIKVNEEWKCLADKDFNKLVLFLTNHLTKFSVFYHEHSPVVKIENECFNTDEFELFETILKELLQFKKKHGKWKNFKEVGRLL